jgi:hypothetical protein
MPRTKAKQPWLAEGISRSTWYRRRKKAREQAAAAQAAIVRQAALDRLEWQITQLRGELETAARYMDERRGDPRRIGGYDQNRRGFFLCKRFNVMGLMQLARGGFPVTMRRSAIPNYRLWTQDAGYEKFVGATSAER